MDLQELIDSANDMKEMLIDAGLSEDDYGDAMDFLNDLVALYAD